MVLAPKSLPFLLSPLTPKDRRQFCGPYLADLSLQMPTELADGLGLEGTLLATARYTPRTGSPARFDDRLGDR